MVLQNKSPYEVLITSVPYYSNLKVIGSLCYATIVPQPTARFSPRLVKRVFLGYHYAKKGYKVFN